MPNMPVLVKRWKVRTSQTGVVLTLNGQEFELGASGDAIAFDIARAAQGWNAPEVENKICGPSCRTKTKKVNDSFCNTHKAGMGRKETK